MLFGIPSLHVHSFKKKVFPVASFLLFFGGEKSVDGCVDSIGSVSRNCSDRKLKLIYLMMLLHAVHFSHLFANRP